MQEEKKEEEKKEDAGKESSADAVSQAAPESGDAGEAQEDEQPRKRHILRDLLITLAVLAVAFAALVLTHRIVFFRDGVYLWLTERVELDLQEEEIPKLDYLTHLRQADLRKSKCFREIAHWAERNPQVEVSYTVDYPPYLSYDPTIRTADLTKLSHDDAWSAAEDYVAYERNTETVLLDLSGWTAEQLKEFQAAFPSLTLRGTLPIERWTVEEVEELCAAFPEVTPEGTVTIAGATFGLEEEMPDLSRMKTDGFDELEEILPRMPHLTGIDFGREEEGYEKLAQVSDFMEAHPDLKVRYIFTAFEKKINIHTPVLDFNHIKMDDDGEEVREILKHMPKVTYLDMDFCGVDDEHMAAIRDDFPEVEVVWRVWFGPGYTVRTDATKILASAYGSGTLTNQNAEPLKYCTKIKYMDIGHNKGLTRCEFLSYMPDLEVLIIAICSLEDITPMADCKHLEFLEIFTNRVPDLSPLKDLKELKHLNIGWNYRIKDLTPIYGLTQLERLWIGRHTSIPKDQVEEFRKLAPDCEVNDWVSDSHTNWRWGTERYALLQEQLGYLTQDYQFPRNDPLYKPHPETDFDMEHVEED
ncbi:MAG: hypothetical protein IJR00_02770 [Lachnospiraceae bacterium]|nr:hypothetical protein [Lachnospiraceae bacterium]